MYFSMETLLGIVIGSCSTFCTCTRFVGLAGWEMKCLSSFVILLFPEAFVPSSKQLIYSAIHRIGLHNLRSYHVVGRGGV